MNTTDISAKLKSSTQELLVVFAEFGSEQVNIVPFEGSWTPGQIAEHLLKSEIGLPHLLAENVTPTERPADEKVPVIESIFLNFETKLKAPEFIIPSNGPHQKELLLNSLKETRAKILNLTETTDLSMTCTAAQFPGLGVLTRWEWINFVICHSIRHTRQLRNILERPQKES